MGPGSFEGLVMLAPDQHSLRVILRPSSIPMTIACPRAIAPSEVKTSSSQGFLSETSHGSLRWFKEGVMVEMTGELKVKEERR